MRGLAYDPAERFASCQEFADAFLGGAGIFDRTPAGGVPAVEGPRRGRILAATTVALIAGVVLSVGFLAGLFSPTPRKEERARFEVTLLSPGALPRRVLRYRPAPGRVETMLIDIDTEESKHFGELVPSVSTKLPHLSIRLRLEVTDVAENGDVSFAWKCAEMALEAGEGTPAPMQEALRNLTKSIQGRSGSGRRSARGIHRDIRHDSPPPKEPEVYLLFDTIAEILEQISAPLPKEPVGIGARWEITYARNREGIRFTQTVTFELESFGENEARLKTYVAVAGLNQTFEHPEVPAAANARLKTGHGRGEGELVIEFDQFSDRNVRMTVESRMEYSVMVGEEERTSSEVRHIRYESKRE